MEDEDRKYLIAAMYCHNMIFDDNLFYGNVKNIAFMNTSSTS